MDQEQILARITAMADDERRPRDALASGQFDGGTEQQRLGQLERELDQCWDLLRRRRAKTEFEENPDDAAVRLSSEAEGYQS